MKSLHSFASLWRRKSISCCRWSALCHGTMCDPGLIKRYKGYKLPLKRKNSSTRSIKPKVLKEWVKIKIKYWPWVPTVLTMYSVSYRIYNKWAMEPPQGDSYILTNLTDSFFPGEKKYHCGNISQKDLLWSPSPFRVQISTSKYRTHRKYSMSR